MAKHKASTVGGQEVLRPHNEDAERAVVGACLIDGAAIARPITSQLTPSDFYHTTYGMIWQALLEVCDAGKPIDHVVVVDQLDRNGVLEEIGGAAKLTELNAATPTALNVEHYSEIVKRCAGQRRLMGFHEKQLGDLVKGTYTDVDPDILRTWTVEQLLQVKGLERFVDTEPSTWADLDAVIGPIEWAWQGWLPKGFLTILVGEPGVGKSILALRLCAAFLGTSELWPDSSRYAAEAGSVLWCEAEAAQPLNLERAKSWGLPLDRLVFPFDDPMRDVQLDNPEHRRAIAALIRREDVRFCVIDSLSGASGGDENSSEALATVHWIAEQARDSGRPILVNHHLRKRGLFDGDDKVTLARVRGYSGIVQPARIVLALDTPDPMDEDTKRLSVIKSNLGRFPEPLGLQITEQGVIFCDAPQPPKKYSALDEAKDAIRSILGAGPLPAADVEDDLEGRGIAERTAARAKRELGIISRKEGKTWYWGLPSQNTLPPELLK